MTWTLLLLVLLFCLANVAVGVCAAGFFGYGPCRHSTVVRFVSDPVIEPAQLLAFVLPRQRRATIPVSDDSPHAGN